MSVLTCTSFCSFHLITNSHDNCTRLKLNLKRRKRNINIDIAITLQKEKNNISNPVAFCCSLLFSIYL